MQETRSARKELELGTGREVEVWMSAAHIMERHHYVMTNVEHMDISCEDVVEKATNRNECRTWIAVRALHGV